MRTAFANPNTIEEVQATIQNWLGAHYREAKPPCRLSLEPKQTGLNVFIALAPRCDLKVKIIEPCLLFEFKQTRLNLNLERFVVCSDYGDERLSVRIDRDPEPEHRLLGSALKQFRKTKHPAFCARMLRAVKELEANLTSTLIDEATSAPTDQLVMVEAVSSAPWVSELAVQDPIVAAKLRGFELRQEMLKKSGGALSSGKVAELLNVSRQAVDKRRAANQLLALTQGRRGYSYPTFQFENGKTLEGLETVLKSLSALDPWMQVRFFTSPHERLADKTPIEALRKGRTNDVVRVASEYGEQGPL